MIKRFRLPDAALAAESFVDLMRRSALDRIHDLGQRIDLHSFFIDPRSENHVNMIRHHHSNPQVELDSVIV